MWLSLYRGRGRGKRQKKPDQVLYVPGALQRRSNPEINNPKHIDLNTPEANMITNITKTGIVNKNDGSTKSGILENTISSGSICEETGKDKLTIDKQDLSICTDELDDKQLQVKDCVRGDPQILHCGGTFSSAERIEEDAELATDVQFPLSTEQDPSNKDCGNKGLGIGLKSSKMVPEYHVDSGGSSVTTDEKTGEKSLANSQSSVMLPEVITNVGHFEGVSPSSSVNSCDIQECFTSEAQVVLKEEDPIILNETDTCSSSFQLSKNCCSITGNSHSNSTLREIVKIETESTDIKIDTEIVSCSVDANCLHNAAFAVHGKDSTASPDDSADHETRDSPSQNIEVVESVVTKLDASTNPDACTACESKSAPVLTEPAVVKMDSGSVRYSEDYPQMTPSMSDKESPEICSKEGYSSANLGREDYAEDQDVITPAQEQVSAEQALDESGSVEKENTIRELDATTESETGKKVKKRKTKKGDDKDSRKKSKLKEEKRKKRKEKKDAKEDDSGLVDDKTKCGKAETKVKRKRGSAENSRGHLGKLKDAAESNTGNEESGDNSDDWDTIYNDAGECLDPELMVQQVRYNCVNRPKLRIVTSHAK